MIGKLSNNTLQIDVADNTLYYCKLSSTQTSKYVSTLPVIVAVDYTDIGVRKSKQQECLKINFLDNVNPFTNTSTSSVVDATISINQIVEEVTMDVNIAMMYRGYGIAKGGLDGQVLLKSGSGEYDTRWVFYDINSLEGLSEFSSSVNTSLNSLNSYTSSNNVSILNLNTFTSSVNTSLSNLNTFTSSVNTSLTSLNTSITSLNSYTSSNNTFTSSVNTSLSNLNTFTSSVNTSLTSLNSYTSSNNVSILNLNLFTSSFTNFSSSVSSSFNSKENSLGNPSTSGYILSSTSSGTRSWIINSGTWGAITGTLSSQTDLQSALNLKANLAGANTFTGTQTIQDILPSLGNTYSIGNGGAFFQNSFFQNSNINTLSGNQASFNSYKTNGNGINIGSATTNFARIFETTGNFLLQNGGTYTDTGEKLQVNGTSKFTGAATFTGGIISNGAGGISSNTAIGSGSLAANTIGVNNTSFGIFSLSLNTTGGGNVGVGYYALSSNTTGLYNNAIGQNSMKSNTIGSYNAGFGLNALFSNTTGSYNISIGSDAGRFIYGGITANTITNNSIYLGANTKPLADNQTNQIVIGNNATGNGSNTTVLGNTLTTQTQIFGNTILSNTAQATDTGEKLQINGTAKFSGNLSIYGGNLYMGQLNGGIMDVSNGSNIGMRYDNTQMGGSGLNVVSSTNQISFSSGYGGTLFGGFKNGSFVVGTTAPNASSVLDVQSTTKGFLPPRMTTAQRLAIASPAVGLHVYQTDMVEGLYVNKTTGWQFAY